MTQTHERDRDWHGPVVEEYAEPKEEGWEKEFDRRFVPLVAAHFSTDAEVKSFIRARIIDERAKWEEDLEVFQTELLAKQEAERKFDREAFKAEVLKMVEEHEPIIAQGLVYLAGGFKPEDQWKAAEAHAHIICSDLADKVKKL